MISGGEEEGLFMRDGSMQEEEGEEEEEEEEEDQDQDQDQNQDQDQDQEWRRLFGLGGGLREGSAQHATRATPTQTTIR